MVATAQVLLEVRGKARDLKGTYDDQFILDLAVNPTIREIEQNSFTRSVSATIPTVIGQAAYNLPATVGVLHWVEQILYGPEKRILEYKDHGRLRFDSNGTPEFWSMWAGKLEFDPVPSSIVTIFLEIWCSPTEATAGAGKMSDELLVGLQVKDALVNGSSWRLCEIDSEYARADRYQRQYLKTLSDLRAKKNPDQGDSPSLIDESGLDSYILGDY